MSYSVMTRASRASNSPLKCPEADASYFYAVCRALSFFPQINGNSAFFEEAELAPLIGSDKGFKFGLANVMHSVGPGKTNEIIGTIRDEALIPGEGVDLLVQLDRRACDRYGVDPEDLISGDLSNVSIEILCDRDKSRLVAFTDPGSKSLEKQRIFSAEEASSLGIERTRWAQPNPYLYEGKYVVAESCAPIRCRGIAFVSDPADTTANVFEVAASLEMAEKKKEPYGNVDYADNGYRDGKKRYPVDTPEHVRAAASYFGQQKNRDKYTPEQQKTIQDKIDAAKKKFGIGDEENSGWSLADVPDMPQAIPNYADIDAIDVDAAMGSDMPDDAFADTYFNPEECADERAYPLYASPAHYVQGKPHPGLVKAALQAHADGKIQNRQSALQRLKVAHSQLHGAKSMDDKEQLATELAGVKTKLAEVQATLESKDSALTDKDTEIASLKDENKKLTDEIAALKTEKEAKAAEELASKRFGELSAIEGFSVKDEEKASLLDALKTEDQLAFENRVLKAKINSMEEAAKKKPTDKKKDDEEDASLIVKAALGNLDFVPTGAKTEGEVDIFAIM